MSQAGRSFTNSGPGGFIQTLTGDTGTPAFPTAGNIDLLGSHGINTVSGGSTVTFAIDNAITLGDLVPLGPGVDALTLTTGDLSLLSGNINLPTTSALGADGVINVNGARFVHSFGGANTFVGSNAGNFVLTGINASAFGYFALNSLSTGNSNSAFGENALALVTTGSQNSGFGAASLIALVSGSGNTALGYNSGSAYTTNESNNILIGNTGVIADNARIRIGTNGTHTTAFVAGINGVNVGNVASVVSINGDQLGTTTLTAGTDITITPGPNTITISTSGTAADSFPTDVGTATPAAGVLNIFGAHNVNTTGGGNTVTVHGNNAITLGDLVPIAANSGAVTATTGDVIITAGDLTLPNTNAAGNQGIIKFGGNRWISNYGTGNTFVGETSGNTSLTVLSALYNTGVGLSSLAALTTGTENAALGAGALQAVTIGNSNVGVGLGAMQTLTSGGNNVALGHAALRVLQTTSDNISIGASSGVSLTTGARNFFAGTLSGSNLLTGTNNVVIGYQSGSSLAGAESNNILISSSGNAGVSARIRIGANGTHTTAFIAGIDGVNVGSVAKVVTMASDQLGTATITAGTGVSVVPGANTITINATGGGVSWSVITLDQTAAVNNGYFANKAGTLALALPAASAVGDIIEVANENTALGVQFTQAAGQQILIGNTNTTLGATGTLTSSAVGDTLKLVCKTANTIWRVTSIVGNWSPA